MLTDNTIIERVFSKINQDELVHLAMALTDIDSPTGWEQEIADFIFHWFEENGFYPMKQEVESQRFNAIGILRGVEHSPSLTLNGHLDTVASRQPTGRAYVSDGQIHGNEIANMKAGLASIMIAAKTIKEAGVQLKGDLIVATVSGEISVAPVGQFQKPQDRGEGVGTRHLLANGIQSDYAIVADGSEYAIVRAQPGVAYFKITTQGIMAYSPFAMRSESVNESQNAAVKMTEVIRAIEDWSRIYESRAIYKFPGGKIELKSVITGIEAGMPLSTKDGWREPFNPSLTPPTCDLYLDVRFPPGVSPMNIKHELEETLGRLPFDLEIQMFRSQKGYEGKGPEVDYLCSVIEESYEHVFQSKPPPAPVGVASMWTDTNLYWEIGIPAVKWGPCEIAKYHDRTVAEIKGLLQATKVFSLAALEICGVAEK